MTTHKGMAQHPVGPSEAEIEDTANYIAQICAELAHMASAHQLDMLAYFLSMARTEAEIARMRAEGRRS